MAAASPMALPGPTRALAHTHSEATSCVSLGSSLLAMPGTVQMGRASTSAAHTLVPGRRGMAVSMYGSIGGAPVDGGMLWEARTPFPNQFPLHVKDTRKLIDTVSMASMVLDRHDFCYRFQLGHCRMRWVARRARRHQLALHCFVRSTLVAEIFVDYEKGYSPNSLHAAAAAAHHAPVYSSSSASSSGTSTPLAAPAAAPAPALDAPLPEDGSLPVLTILCALFDQLAGVDADVAESFVVFTGMQALECLHI
ncbi:hypothetical protein IWQ56_007128 [Coemansia nantahalensis]|nr:hypothetical protein IWQ56_007128 [Coemansia nantahalensis]